eukprot:227425_1
MTSFLISLCIPISSASTWITSTTKLPKADDAMTIGCYDNNSIFLLGGDRFGRQLTEYDISQDTFAFDRTFFDTSYSRSIYGISYYTQIDHMLYILVESGLKLLSYNMKSQTITDNFVSIDVDAYYGCLASNSDHLFVVGGYDSNSDLTSNILQVLYLPTKTWLNNTPTMKEKRIQFTCIVDPLSNILYAIGGADSANNFDTYTKTIEYVDTNNIISNAWSYFPGELNQPYGWMRSVWYKQLIFIVGGANGQEGAWSILQEVNIIDTVHNNVYLSPDPLPYAASSMSVIVVGNTLYAFGGYASDGSYLDSFVSYDLNRVFSSSTSHIPTETPTGIPSVAPSNTPSHAPSDKPTANPSEEIPVDVTPSHAPSDKPTTNPSYAPSVIPSNAPIATANPSTAPHSSIPTSTTHVSVPAPTSIMSTTGHISTSEESLAEFPTYGPNISPTANKVTTQVTQHTHDNTMLNDDKNSNNWMNQVDLRMFVMSCIAIVSCIVCLVILWIKKRKSNSKQHKENVAQIVTDTTNKTHVEIQVIEDDLMVELQTVMKRKRMEGGQRDGGSRSNNKRHSSRMSEGVVEQLQFTVEGNILKEVNENNMNNIEPVCNDNCDMQSSGNDYAYVTKGTDDTYNIGNRCDDFVIT